MVAKSKMFVYVTENFKDIVTTNMLAKELLLGLS